MFVPFIMNLADLFGASASLICHASLPRLCEVEDVLPLPERSNQKFAKGVHSEKQIGAPG